MSDSKKRKEGDVEVNGLSAKPSSRNGAPCYGHKTPDDRQIGGDPGVGGGEAVLLVRGQSSSESKTTPADSRGQAKLEANSFASNPHQPNASPSTGHKTPDDQTIGGDPGVGGGEAVLLVRGQSSSESKATPADSRGQAKLKELFSAKNKSPPKSANFGDPDPDLDEIDPLIKAEIDPLIKEGKIEKYVEGSEDHLMLIFLFVRGVPQYLEEKKETKKKAELFTEILTEGNKGRERLLQIMKLGSDHEAGVDHHQHCPNTWLPKYPFDSDSGLQQWVPVEDDSNSDAMLVTIFKDFKPNQAKQCSKNCYLVAATTCYAYAVRRATGRWMKVDVATYIRYVFSPEKLYDRIVRNKGGRAIDVFEHLSEHNSTTLKKIRADEHNFIAKDFYKYLTQFGAGLVTKFHVDDNFRNSSNSSFSGTVAIDKTKTTGHAMVLVGVRIEKSGQCWVLLQNWWEGKQFVEVTLEYLKSSNAFIYFTTDEHTKNRDLLTTSATDCLYTEADFDDGGDEEEEDYDDEDASDA
jgi:hypothetical protein